MMDYLYAAQFMVQAGTAAYQYQQAENAAEAQRQDAYRQAATNNQLAFNAHLSLRQEEVLELNKYGLDTFELKKAIRRERAKSAATQTSFRGNSRDKGGSYGAVLANIERHGYNALARKDLNFQAKINDFQVKHKNVTLGAISQNNAAFSGLSTGGNLFGTTLSIAGSGLQLGMDRQKGLDAVKGSGTTKPTGGTS